MQQTIIENPIINSPFEEPTRHFRFADEGITNQTLDGRRTSAYFVPIVASDFSLIDAIEAGIVKVPRVPVADDSMTGDQPTYRDLWLRIREDLPKKGRKTAAVGGEPKLSVELQGALLSLYGNYVKNHNLGFTIPYTLNGEEHQYTSDFIACIDDGHSQADLLNLIVEGSGQKKKDKAAKVATARTLWAPAINNHGGFGRWAFIEVDDPWDAQNVIRKGMSAC